jgi:hypothetical protein
MSSFDRRRFLSAAAASTALALTRPSWAAAGASPSFTIHTDKALAHVPADFTGLSYESSQLIHPTFFNADNTTLVQFFKTLGAAGVLRLGGNMSEFTEWSPIDPVTTGDDEGVEGPDPGKGSKRTFTITPRSIVNLAGFLNATGWKLIYGLNLARGNSESAADEAAFVSKTIGKNLLAFQFGNEPDLFKHNGDPKDRWKYPEFIAKWREFEKAVRAKVPGAPLAGPDTSFNPAWVGTFAKDTSGKASIITAHYYAEGPPTDPRMNIDFLLNQQERFRTHILDAVSMCRAAGLPYRMSEGNTCYNAGKPGVSDTFASALWAGDFLAQIAAIGGTGVNLHGGGNGLYTPIAGSRKEGFSARPDYYGMLMTRPLLGATILNSELQTAGVNLTAYAAQKKGKLLVLAFNKDSKPTSLSISAPAHRLSGPATVLRLTGPAITATSGVTLGGSAVASDGTWKPSSSENIAAETGALQLSLPAYSAALVSFV